MIIVTGAAGFIGSCIVQHLNHIGVESLILVDKFDRKDKNKNLAGSKYHEKIDRDSFLDWFGSSNKAIEFVLHIGARTDTTEKDKRVFDELNLNYSISVAKICIANNIPLIYASSAATYGMGEEGFDDNTLPQSLTPMNPYGHSKNDFDHWLMSQVKQPPFWAGLKFFNVFGPNEYHKGRMASVIYHTFRQIQESGEMKLFRSHRKDYENGEQSRDFIYIKDLLNVIDFMMNKRPDSGFNLA